MLIGARYIPPLLGKMPAYPNPGPPLILDLISSHPHPHFMNQGLTPLTLITLRLCGPGLLSSFLLVKVFHWRRKQREMLPRRYQLGNKVLT